MEHGRRTFTREQTMSNNAELKSCELTDNELDAVGGGGARTEPNESLSLNFTKVQWTYTPPDPC